MVEDVFLPGIETVIEDIVRVSIDDSDQLTDNDYAVTETTRAVTYGTTSQTITALNLTATLEDLPAGTYTIDETGYDDTRFKYKWNRAYSWIKADKMPVNQSGLADTERIGETSTDALVGMRSAFPVLAPWRALMRHRAG